MGHRMEKISTWAFVGLLTYMCVILTSINENLEALNASGVDVAVLNEVHNQAFNAGDAPAPLLQPAESGVASSLQPAIIVAAAIFVFVSWNISRIYHNHQWMKRSLRRRYASFNEPAILGKDRRTAIHLDQDCVRDKPLPDGRIKTSWLPERIREMHSRK